MSSTTTRRVRRPVPFAACSAGAPHSSQIQKMVVPSTRRSPSRLRGVLATVKLTTAYSVGV